MLTQYFDARSLWELALHGPHEVHAAEPHTCHAVRKGPIAIRPRAASFAELHITLSVSSDRLSSAQRAA